jgi:hypothetical protein
MNIYFNSNKENKAKMLLIYQNISNISLELLQIAKIMNIKCFSPTISKLIFQKRLKSTEIFSICKIVQTFCALTAEFLHLV